MIVMTDITPQVYEMITQMVRLGKYTSLESFVDISIRNQLTLEKSTFSEVTPEVNQETTPKSTVNYEKSDPYGFRQLSKNQAQNLTTVPSIALDPKRRSEPMWGLINRFVPAKVVLRILVNSLSRSNTQWLEFNQFSDEVVTIASQIRRFAEKFEKRSDVIRGQSLKIGFPMKDPKSQQRFVDTFVGKLRNENHISGLLGELELVAIRKSQQGNTSSTMIGISEKGKLWANMDSPFIDDFITNQKPIQNPLSYEEIYFILTRVKYVKPGDYEYLNYIYKLVKEGIDTPEKLSHHTSLYLQSLKLNPKIFNNYQTGAIARLVEMRIIQLEKKGIRTRYVVTSTANSLEDLHKSISKYSSLGQNKQNGNDV
jgi:hypothetical protein